LPGDGFEALVRASPRALAGPYPPTAMANAAAIIDDAMMIVMESIVSPL